MKKFASVLVAAGLIFSAGCTPPAGEPGKPVSGTMRGYCAVYDTTFTYYRTLLADKSGVAVELEGTTLRTTTDATGTWVLKDIPAGSYTVRLSKPGFSTMRLPDMQCTGGDITAAPVALTRLTGFYLFTEFDRTGNTTGYAATISAVFAPPERSGYNFKAPNNEQGLLLLVSPDSAASPYRPESYLDAYATLNNTGGSIGWYNRLSYSIDLRPLLNKGAAPGADIYISGFPYWRWRENATVTYEEQPSATGKTFYRDPATGNFVSTATDTTQVRRIKVKMP